MLVRKLEYVLVGFAIVMVLIACLASCRFSGVKVEADTIYGNGMIEVGEGELELPAPE